MAQEFQGKYNPEDVNIIVNGVTIEGVDEQTFVEIERLKPEEYMVKVGAKGDYTYVRNLDRSAKIKITLKQNARRSMNYLASLLESDAVFDTQIVRKAGPYKELVQAINCVIGLRPRINFAAEEQPRQWEVLSGKLTETDKEE
jgi:hypothetical protein